MLKVVEDAEDARRKRRRSQNAEIIKSKEQRRWDSIQRNCQGKQQARLDIFRGSQQMKPAVPSTAKARR